MGLSLRLAAVDSEVYLERGALEKVNALLAADGHPVHTEPVGLSAEAIQAECRFAEYRSYPSIEVPYGFLHLLRRIWVRHALDSSFVPTPVDQANDDPVYEDALGDTVPSPLILESHLCNHSDADGAYLPVRFPLPLWVGRTSFGSTFELLRELEQIGPCLGMTGADPVGTWSAQPFEEGPLEREQHLWAALVELIRLSHTHRTALVFS